MGYRFLQSRTILTSLTRFSLRRNNHRTPLPSVVGNPRRFVTYTGFPNRYSLPWFVQGDFVDKHGTSSIPPVVRMMEEAEQQPLFDTSASYNGRVPDAQRKPAGHLKQDKDALYFKMDMPGVGKEDARVYLEGSTLIVKGVRKLDTEFEDEDEDEDDETILKSTLLGLV
ncbi:23.6 kDa heat shock protein, mitochondrial isoform X1 [Beta vulgaris subsp. vulgaris]|uniref:23.6 kDa heat shock protein, mitochondrial isoform X1 n=1 Tax=Beta vulgaris subsp. vulgaris TaxID=3555 RepID=UPI0020367556|nr:23.6 kDa heat shock protein, mitochondrial isoform X1 [Beta vulgaris subsp. vulgaris]